MSRISRSPSLRQAGLGLVEIMVGMTMGMLAIIVIMQVFLLSEDQKRTTTGGADAQSTGVLTLHEMQRDIGQAGFGFSSTEVMGCALSWTLPSGAAIATPVSLAPVQVNPPANIVPAGDTNTDTLLVMYGNPNDQPQGNALTLRSGQSYTVQMPDSFAVGDRVISVASGCPGNLLLDRVTAAPPTTSTTISVAGGQDGANLFNLGQQPQILAYAVRNGSLTVCDYLRNDCGNATSKSDASVWVPLASNIVSLRAQYGRNTASPIGTEVNSYDQSTPGTRADWQRITALRLVLVARSEQAESRINDSSGARECNPVTPSAPGWEGSSANAIDLSGNSDWKCYRYKLFQAVVPLRNVIWMGGQA